MFGISQEINVDTELQESGIADILKKCTASNQLSGGLGAETTDASRKILLSNSVINLDQILGGVEREARCNHMANRSNDPISSPIGLKLDQSIDNGEVKSYSSLMENSDFSSVEPLLLGKRPRTTNLYSQVPLCQVYGCNKDLSSSKGYHKRHRVCDEHSKTAKVIVNGVEQMFCQQCSRFHLLEEFDECRRSCRKSLAGHNERRRKPQVDTHWSKLNNITLFKPF
ncbi:hypothetical protein RND71_040715 [Anisodus tanguticus]|uniref:SBP-type domain-containing protein n=1 Tax=Anisodus tanguticus TaxID=243964 RepID=A0AAE1QTC6_9SOLA|nr:hypothetical protein RND71_040715 [Anisodus tanguticus]